MFKNLFQWSTQYLGLLINDRFPWTLHIDSVYKKQRSILGKISNLRLDF